MNSENWIEYKYTDLFTIQRGNGPTATKAKEQLGTTRYIGASEFNGGITALTNYAPTHPANSLTVANNGSIGATFYQTQPYTASTDVSVLVPKFELNIRIAMFLTTLIQLEKPKYNYGRKWTLTRMNKSTIKLPSKDGQPDWNYMEQYIKPFVVSATDSLGAKLLTIFNNMRNN